MYARLGNIRRRATLRALSSHILITKSFIRVLSALLDRAKMHAGSWLDRKMAMDKLKEEMAKDENRLFKNFMIIIVVCACRLSHAMYLLQCDKR